ncbi:MAG: aconitase family protein, partial [Hyphomicrobiales bacterium]|nr:aconitase family protein [Hyphomicrobiales bacterium]
MAGERETGAKGSAPGRGRTLIDKIWDSHEITRLPSGQSLLFVDRHFIHDGTSQAFEKLDIEGHGVRSPERTIGTADHYVPTKGGLEALSDPARADMVRRLERDADRFGITRFGFGDARQGIVHVVGPELGLTLPGFVLVCGDSHTSTHGALGAFAFGVGASEVAHVLATQTLWQTRPGSMRITLSGALGAGVTAKDLILHVIATIGAGGATGRVIEYAGPAIEALPMEGRLTLCNMSIEAGARAGLVAPDETTFRYLKGRPYAPTGALWERALDSWRGLRSDEEAVFDREVAVDAAVVAPTVTWGTSPEDAVPVTAAVPDPTGEPDAERRRRMQQALDYMGLQPGTPMQRVPVDRVFIG